jgi:anti-sigma regulatory factor (Ser/Thr protein kinase)
LFENYYKSQDILNGDALFTIYLSENHYIVGIIDAMGKGLSASLTSINSVTFMEYSIKKAIEYRDFDFRRLIKDFLNYTKSILIKEEILCGIILNVKNDTIEYANFGMPPIYTNEQKYLANNPPISKRLENFYINKFSLPEKFIILSDGLIESNLKQSGIPYYANFKKLYKKINFLKELITDFKNNANQTDDISVIFFKKDKINNKIFEIEKKIHDVKDVDEILTQIYISDLHQDSLTFILQEILMNTLEHSLYNLKEKKINKTINDAQKIKDFVKIKITFYKQDGYLKVHYAEDSEGFDKNEIDIDPKYHGRGLKIVKHLADGFYMNLKGNEIKIFLKEKDEKRD